MRLLCAYAVRACARVFGSRSLLGDVCFNLQLCARIDRGNGCGYGFQTSISHTWTRFEIPKFMRLYYYRWLPRHHQWLSLLCVCSYAFWSRKNSFTHTHAHARALVSIFVECGTRALLQCSRGGLFTILVCLMNEFRM